MSFGAADFNLFISNLYKRISASFWPDPKTDLPSSRFQVKQMFNFKSLSPLRLLQAFFLFIHLLCGAAPKEYRS